MGDGSWELGVVESRVCYRVSNAPKVTHEGNVPKRRSRFNKSPESFRIAIVIMVGWVPDLLVRSLAT
jgi:hypothetical protein